MLPPNFTEEASKTIVSCEASSKFHRRSLQNDRFARCFLQISQKKLPKGSFRAMLPPNFTEEACKSIVSCEASSKFHRTSCQKDRFVRGFLEISQNKLPKRSFRARLPRNFTEEARKINVSCDASDNFHRTSFQNERFARCFRQFSQKKLPKWSFHARLPPNFIEQCFQNERFARCFRQFQQKICISPQFRAIDPPNPTRGFIQQKQNVRLATTACHPKFQNARFTTAACAKMYESSARRPGQPKAYKNHHFTTVSDVWPARSDERVARASSKFAFHHSFGRPISTKRREGCAGPFEICVSPQFWMSDNHEVTRGLRPRSKKFAFHHSFGRPTTTKWREGCVRDLKNLHFTTVLGVRRPRSDERVVSRRCQPNPPGVKRRRNF